MKSRGDNGQKGVILVLVLLMLTLFGLVGVTFFVYTAGDQCDRNPTVEMREGTCTNTIGNTADRTP